jgi:hypothetical protein
VHSIDRLRASGRIGDVTSAGAVALLVAACSTSSDRAPGEAGDVGHRGPPATTRTEVAAQRGDSRHALPPPHGVRNWTEVRQQAAERIVAANPGTTYTGGVPDPLLAIPVLEIELNADGSIRRIEVLREPRQAKETLQIALDAVRRAAPFGDVSRLPRPWKFVETFLFDDSRKFKPRTLER